MYMYIMHISLFGLRKREREKELRDSNWGGRNLRVGQDYGTEFQLNESCHPCEHMHCTVNPYCFCFALFVFVSILANLP